MEENYYRLIVEYFEKTISDDGLTQLQEWIEQSPENLVQFTETIRILEASRSYFKKPDNAEKVWKRVNAHIHGQRTPYNITNVKKFRWPAYAAACFLFALSWIGYKQIANQPKLSSEFEAISNADGKKSKVLLPDSSTVYLGGGSTIKFSKEFKDRERVVYLNGEAFFDVVHNAKRPFIVKSGEISTVVLGTSFNVKAYGAEQKVAVTVKTGKVGVMAVVNGKQQLVKFLLPDEQLNINTKNGLYTFNTANASAISSWIENNLIYYNTSLRDIATSVEHHYGVKVDFTDPDLGNIKLTAKFNNTPLPEVIETLSTLSGLACTQKGNHLFISNSNQKGGRIMK